MRLRHRVRTSATAGQVWSVLGDPVRWPEFDVFLHRVRGASGMAATGQHLLGVGRGLGLPLPVDVVEAAPERRLVLRVHAAPGVVEEVSFEITPLVRGGCDLAVSVVVEGLFARPAALPLWLARGLTSRLLARRVETIARAARRAA
ncbi:MAG TPA: SRPBCC family protein [Mycobacteriales bacterium]|jgi:hypothetical protein|nr:SRPBCC family protein [Mycobacteriales bacterium]